jgi:hypothetical protein
MRAGRQTADRLGAISPNISLSSLNEVFTHKVKVREEQIKSLRIRLLYYQTRIMMDAFYIRLNSYLDMLDVF